MWILLVFVLTTLNANHWMRDKRKDGWDRIAAVSNNTTASNVNHGEQEAKETNANHCKGEVKQKTNMNRVTLQQQTQIPWRWIKPSNDAESNHQEWDVESSQTRGQPSQIREERKHGCFSSEHKYYDVSNDTESNHHTLNQAIMNERRKRMRTITNERGERKY